VTFSPPPDYAPPLDLLAHEPVGFADECLQDSFERAGLDGCLPAFRRFVGAAHGQPAYCAPAARLGCWRLNAIEATTLHAVASLQAGRFGEAWHTLCRICPRAEAARAMLALGEISEEFARIGARIRPWGTAR
jgi:hypothetical protein